jgi:hypothetical protein
MSKNSTNHSRQHSGNLLAKIINKTNIIGTNKPIINNNKDRPLSKDIININSPVTSRNVNINLNFIVNKNQQNLYEDTLRQNKNIKSKLNFSNNTSLERTQLNFKNNAQLSKENMLLSGFNDNKKLNQSNYYFFIFNVLR